MNLILCMAGLYSRFKSEGYKLPKFLLPVSPNQTMLEQILNELHATNKFERTILVMNFRDESYLEDVKAKTARYSPTIHFVRDTRGQAETAAIAAELTLGEGADTNGLFHNIDTIIKDRDFSRLTKLSDIKGFIDVFESQSKAFSYVSVDPKGLVVDIKEKVVISKYATSGAYYFSSLKNYLHYYSRLDGNGERYISDVYKLMIDQGEPISIYPATGKETVVLGTPIEYETYVRDHALHKR